MNGDLFGFKFDAWEGGHRIPFIARWPGRISPATKSNSLVSNVDLFATVADVAGRNTAEGQASDEGPDSVSLLPALVGEPGQAVREHLLIAPARASHLSIRKGDWMYIDAPGGGGFSSPKVGDHGFGGPAARGSRP